MRYPLWKFREVHSKGLTMQACSRFPAAIPTGLRSLESFSVILEFSGWGDWFCFIIYLCFVSEHLKIQVITEEKVQMLVKRWNLLLCIYKSSCGLSRFFSLVAVFTESLFTVVDSLPKPRKLWSLRNITRLSLDTFKFVIQVNTGVFY